MKTSDIYGELRLKVGVGALLFNDKGMLLLGKRLGSHESGKWAPPGGSMEENETPAQTVFREVKEEVGIKPVGPLFKVGFSYDEFPAIGRRFVTLLFSAYVGSQESQLLEPSKCSEWQWFDVHKMPPIQEQARWILGAHVIEARNEVLLFEQLRNCGFGCNCHQW